GALKGYEAPELGAIAIRGALDRVDVADDEVEYVIMGQVLQGGAGQAPARQAAIAAGLPKEIPSDTINKVCASSIRAVEIADQMIRSGDHSVIVAGGMESMSNAPYVLKKALFQHEIVPVGERAVDEGPRRDTTLEKLAALKPVFDPEGTTTAGNAPGVNDGAGALVVTSDEFARRRGLEILATIVSQGYV